MPQVKVPKGYKKGKAKKSYHCCREIRICSPNKLGEVYSGWTNFGDSETKHQTVMVIKESHPYDMSKTIVVELNPI